MASWIFLPSSTSCAPDLGAAAQAGGDDLRAAATLLAAAVDPAVRMVLLDALVAAADELTGAAGIVVEVRLRGHDVELVAHAEPEPALALPPPGPPVADEGDIGTARVSLRLPEALKVRAEAAAAADGVSLNTWLVRAIAAATTDGASRRTVRTPGQRLSGWARS